MEVFSVDQQAQITIDTKSRKATITSGEKKYKVQSEHFRNALAVALSNHGRWLAIASFPMRPHVVILIANEAGEWEEVFDQSLSFSDVELQWNETSAGYPPEDLRVYYTHAPEKSGRFSPRERGWKWVK